MAFNISLAMGCAWGAVGVVWLIGAVSTKRTVRRQPGGARIFHLLLAALGFALLASKGLRAGWLGMRVLPDTHVVAIIGLVLTITGCLFAIWARVTLGTNWSGAATVKAGHQLIAAGPYALARHPIYTGLLTAALGTAVVVGEARCAVGLLLIVLALVVKMSQEERLMLQTFPDAYPAYRQRVKALIPGVF